MFREATTVMSATRIKSSNVQDRIVNYDHLVLATAHCLPFKSESFDYVVACDLSEHLDLPGLF